MSVKVIVAASPVPDAVILLPTKFTFLIPAAVPTSVPSSLTVMPAIPAPVNSVCDFQSHPPLPSATGT